VFGVADLEQENPVEPVAKGTSKRGDGGEWVLTDEGGRKIERHQHDDGVIR